jgi:hypothetical protein
MPDAEKRKVQSTTYSTAEERDIWRDIATKGGRSLSGLIAWLLRQHCQSQGIDSEQQTKTKKKKTIDRAA